MKSPMEEELSWLQSRLSESIRDVRRCVFALRPADLESHGSQEGLQRLVRQFQTQYNLDLALRATVLVQEGLNNTIKHSGATRAKGYILKDAEGEELIAAITAVKNDNISLPRNLAAKVLEEFRLREGA